MPDQVQLLSAGAVKDRMQRLCRKILDRCKIIKAVFFGQTVHIHLCNGIALHRPAGALDGALRDRLGIVRDDQSGVDAQKYTETGALRTGAERIVEGKHTGRQLADAAAVLGTGIILRIQDFFSVNHTDQHQSVRQL